MVQVIDKAFALLGIISSHEPASLKELADLTGMKKPTLFQILKSLTEAGAVRRTEDGDYAIGQGLVEIAFPSHKKGLVSEIAHQATRYLSEVSGESSNAAVAYRGRRFTIAMASSRHTVRVSDSVTVHQNFYRSATGRLLLAHLPEAELATVITRDGLPGAEWPEIATAGRLADELAKLRAEEACLMNSPDDQAAYAAVPVCGPDGQVWLTLGVSLPTSRFVGEHRENILAQLRNARETAECGLALQSGGLR